MKKQWNLIVPADEISRALAELKPAALKVWLYVRWKAGRGEVRAKQATIAAAVGMTARNVRRWLDQLVADGWLSMAATGRAAVFSCPRQNCPVSPERPPQPDRTEPVPIHARARLPLSENLSSKGSVVLDRILGRSARLVQRVEVDGDTVRLYGGPVMHSQIGHNHTDLALIARAFGAERAAVMRA